VSAEAVDKEEEGSGVASFAHNTDDSSRLQWCLKVAGIDDSKFWSSVKRREA